MKNLKQKANPDTVFKITPQNLDVDYEWPHMVPIIVTKPQGNRAT